MSSLRARVLASVLALAAAGMIAVAAVTYAEQRSFLYSRVDQQARSAVRRRSRGCSTTPGCGRRGSRPGAKAAAASAARPATTVADRSSRRAPTDSAVAPRRGDRLAADRLQLERTASRRRRSCRPTSRSSTIFEVPSTSSSGPHYRAYAQGDPEDTGVTIAAVPLTDVEQTLQAAAARRGVS